MNKDIWHYSRQALAKQVLGMFESGLSNALVFFAPRRMGKTEFLLKDMEPYSIKHGWHVHYFSFLDVSENAKEAFTSALINFAITLGSIKSEKLLKHIKKIEGGISGIHAGFEFRDLEHVQITLKEIMEKLAKKPGKILLLMDEVQVLSRDKKNKNFIAALRTTLDVHKSAIKVIFTGSSREGLRRMFSKSDVPFFHFGQNLPFPEFEQDFTDHMAAVYKKTTQRKIDKNVLWNLFLDIDKVPQLLRSLVERLILHPDLTPEKAKNQLLEEIIENREYKEIWEKCSVIERLLIQTIMTEQGKLFSADKRKKMAKFMGIDELPVSTLQSAVRSLQRKNIIGSLPKQGEYYIDDPNFKSWLEHLAMEDEKNI